MNNFIIRPTGNNPIRTGFGRPVTFTTGTPTPPPPPPPSDRTARANLPGGFTVVDNTTFRDHESTAILSNGSQFTNWSVAWNNPNGENVDLWRNQTEDALESRFASNWQAGGAALIERSIGSRDYCYLSHGLKLSSNFNSSWNGFSRFKVWYFGSHIMEIQTGWGNPEGRRAPALALASDYGVNIVTNTNLPLGEWVEIESLIDRRGSNGSHIWSIWVNGALWLQHTNLTLSSFSTFKYTPQASGNGNGSGVATSVFISDSYIAYGT